MISTEIDDIANQVRDRIRDLRIIDGAFACGCLALTGLGDGRNKASFDDSSCSQVGIKEAIARRALRQLIESARRHGGDSCRDLALLMSMSEGCCGDGTRHSIRTRVSRSVRLVRQLGVEDDLERERED